MSCLCQHRERGSFDRHSCVRIIVIVIPVGFIRHRKCLIRGLNPGGLILEKILDTGMRRYDERQGPWPPVPD